MRDLLAPQSPRARPPPAWRSKRRRMNWPASPSTSTRRSSSAEILFDKLGLPVVKKTPPAPRPTRKCSPNWRSTTRCPSCCSNTAAWPSSRAPTPTSCRRWSTRQTGRVHTSFAQATAVTGRLASSDPNLQNIPVRTAEGRRIRAAFIAPPGHSIVSADYSQIELRIMAHLSDDAAPARSLRPRRGRAPRHRRRDLRRHAARSRQRPAPRRQGDQLRPDLRHERLRPGPPARHRTQRRAELHRPLLRALPGVARYMEEHAPWRRARRATSRPCSAAACGCPTSAPARPAAARAPSAPRSTRRCRAPPPT
jgi:hypothetical protein